ncbi:MAG: 16S rRNA (cytosine(967)-C(5))-methyltransferase RsmB [Burkholderiaceae bacterium]|jgi:16S rRNA (cytosine967-C5)-methyltransferase|nr:16S rRNA (cytosine(967)-C(5))-methyltransferase RsmB [Burkholderiaceae bacterium]
MSATPRSTPFRSTLQQHTLGFCLLGAAHTIAQLEAGRSLPRSLAEVFSQMKAGAQASGAMQDIAYRTARQLGLVRELLRKMTAHKPEPALLRALLYCALTLLVKNTEEMRLPYEPFTLVNQCVNAAASTPFLANTRNLVNAILRRFLREQTSLILSATKNTEAMWNYPVWWVNDVRHAYPQDWQTILQAGNSPPPLVIRVNARKTTTENYLARLREAGMGGTHSEKMAITLASPVPVTQLPGWQEGLISVQDASAQLAAYLLDVSDGMSVLDACAAPGGKSCHILETANVNLLAIDSDADRLAYIHDNLQRLQLQATVRQGDATRKDWWDGRLFDRILADVPCTASGIVRRHPDIRWLRKKADLSRLATLSAQIMDNLWQMLRPGGKLLFVTCSIWPDESEKRAVSFATKNHAITLPSPGQILPAAKEAHDGLFYALFQKPDTV